MMSCIAALTFGGEWEIHDKNSVIHPSLNF